MSNAFLISFKVFNVVFLCVTLRFLSKALDLHVSESFQSLSIRHKERKGNEGTNDGILV